MQFSRLYNPEVREWWAGLFKELISDIGEFGI
jgi:alpha-glucosidase